MQRALLVIILFISPMLFAEPVERHGIILSYGVGDIPGFIEKMPDDPEIEGYLRYRGSDLSLSYIYYGKGGYKGAFSGKYTIDWVRVTSFPYDEHLEFLNINRIALNITGIWTAFPSAPVNFYSGIGIGFSVLLADFWTLETTDTGESTRKEKEFIPVPLPPIHIPLGINIRIRNFLLNVETGIRDAVPYVTGGLGFNFGKGEDVKIIKETVQIPPPPPDTGRIKGKVIEAETNAPLARAIIEMKGSGISDLSAGGDGSFITPELKSGDVELVVTKDGYTPRSVKIKVEQGKTIETSIALKKEIQIGAIGGIIQNLEGKPLSAVITVTPLEAVAGTEDIQQLSTTSDANTGEYMIKLKPGNYTVNVRHENYKPATTNAVVKQGFKTKIDFRLEPEVTPPPPAPLPALPLEKKSRVYIEKEKIVITDTIYFVSGKADILPVSFAILDEIAELLSKNPEIHIRIEGHTDSVGNDELNMKLSQARADSVMKYLIRKGIAPERMEARGYGETMPVADNKTPEGRAKNRRVEFVIIKQ